MNICLVTPAPPGSRSGNRVTALRWARILRDLGHRVRLAVEFDRRRYDLLIALHARKSFPSIRGFRECWPARPLILALTGTDVYGFIHTDRRAKRALELADRLVVLQPLAIRELPRRLRAKARTVFQSVPTPSWAATPQGRTFDVCVMGHLRPVKDPFRTAYAARLLPERSRIRVVHLGAALSQIMKRRAMAEMRENPRYLWLGEVSRWRAQRILARCRLLVVSSRSEGGANVISEALALKVPIISTDIPGSTGILGSGYTALFHFRDTAALALLLERAENDVVFYRSLKAQCSRLRPLVEPARERRCWKRLLAELACRPDEV
ncbi:MAG: TIGR04348 family glycosyltransferase [Planctomycetes bacterium]|nr:TIGR04348 family glycosyltransferase [Planctomycetota bacterium]